MKRNGANLKKYRKICRAVLARSSGVCEVLIDGKRCGKYIGEENATWACFMHKGSRNGKSDEWVLDPNNIIFGCVTHHLADPIGTKTEGVEYEEGENIYIPDPN